MRRRRCLLGRRRGDRAIFLVKFGIPCQLVPWFSEDILGMLINEVKVSVPVLFLISPLSPQKNKFQNITRIEPLTSAITSTLYYRVTHVVVVKHQLHVNFIMFRWQLGHYCGSLASHLMTTET